MKDDTKYLLVGAAVLAGGYWWYSSRQKKTVTPTQTYLVGTFGQQGTVIDPLSIAMLKFCANPLGVTNVEKLLIIEEVIRPMYIQERPAYLNEAGNVVNENALFTKIASRMLNAYCGGITPEGSQQAKAWAREVWIAEENLTGIS